MPTRPDPADRLAAAHAHLVRAVEALAGGEEWRRMLAVAAKFPTYSANNILLICTQRPDAQRVAGVRTWAAGSGEARRASRSSRHACIGRVTPIPDRQAAAIPNAMAAQNIDAMAPGSNRVPVWPDAMPPSRRLGVSCADSASSTSGTSSLGIRPRCVAGAESDGFVTSDSEVSRWQVVVLGPRCSRRSWQSWRGVGVVPTRCARTAMGWSTSTVGSVGGAGRWSRSIGRRSRTTSLPSLQETVTGAGRRGSEPVERLICGQVRSWLCRGGRPAR